jgi:hypothetical protein
LVWSEVIAPYQATGLSDAGPFFAALTFVAIPASPAPCAFAGHSSIIAGADDSPSALLLHANFMTANAKSPGFDGIKAGALGIDFSRFLYANRYPLRSKTR